MCAAPSQIAGAGISAMKSTPLGMLSTLTDAATSTIATEKLDRAYGPHFDDFTAKERARYGTYKDMVDAETPEAIAIDGYSPRDLSRFNALNTMEGQFRQMTRGPLTQVGSYLAEKTPLKDETLQIWDPIVVPESLLSNRYGGSAAGGEGSGGGFVGAHGGDYSGIGRNSPDG
jgi:hypothetical protein